MFVDCLLDGGEVFVISGCEGSPVGGGLQVVLKQCLSGPGFRLFALYLGFFLGVSSFVQFLRYFVHGFVRVVLISADLFCSQKLPVWDVGALAFWVVGTVMQICITVSWFLVERCRQASPVEVDETVQKINLVEGVFALEFY